MRRIALLLLLGVLFTTIACGDDKEAVEARVNEAVTLRAGPGSNYAILSVVREGTKFKPVGRNEDGTWVQVIYPPELETMGWLPVEFLTLDGPVAELPTTSPPNTPTPKAQASYGPVEKTGDLAPVAALRDIRTESHPEERFDRITFEFANRLPGYRIEYVPVPVRHCTSGAIVSVAAEIELVISLSPASTHDDEGNLTFAPDEPFAADALWPFLPAITDANEACALDGVVTWVIGMTNPGPFSVSEEEDPYRLIIDVAHP